MIQEAQIDINIDPLLHMACQRDLQKFCGDLEPGEGRSKCVYWSMFDIGILTH